MMKKIKISLAIFVFLSVLSSISFAQGNGSKYAGEFLSIGVGGRPLGMGSAFVALVDDITAGYWNPASLSKIDYPQLSLMHDARFGNLLNYNYGAVAIPIGKNQSLGLSVIVNGIDDIPDTRNAGVLYPDGTIRIDPNLVTYFNANDYAFFLTYSKKQNEKFSYGANFKVIRRTLGDAGNAWGMGFDVGVFYNPIEKLMLGANIQDITTTYVAWSTGKKENISPTAKLGTAYVLDVPFLKGTIIPAVDFDVRFENRRTASNFNVGPVSFDFHGGMEYTFDHLVSIRGGYNEIGDITLGAGIKLPKINIDYSFTGGFKDDPEKLGNTHRISLIFTLEEDKFKRK
ncbi:MAG: PorV/PorQ family protein [Ignavibacteria bacterium]|nr:PorV/PorQ family protein [Ignavibacteria bacterium]